MAGVNLTHDTFVLGDRKGFFSYRAVRVRKPKALVCDIRLGIDRNFVHFNAPFKIPRLRKSMGVICVDLML